MGMVEVSGDEQREIHIDMDINKLSAYAISPAEVAAAFTAGEYGYAGW